MRLVFIKQEMEINYMFSGSKKLIKKMKDGKFPNPKLSLLKTSILKQKTKKSDSVASEETRDEDFFVCDKETGLNSITDVEMDGTKDKKNEIILGFQEIFDNKFAGKGSYKYTGNKV